MLKNKRRSQRIFSPFLKNKFSQQQSEKISQQEYENLTISLKSKETEIEILQKTNSLLREKLQTSPSVRSKLFGQSPSKQTQRRVKTLKKKILFFQKENENLKKKLQKQEKEKRRSRFLKEEVLIFPKQKDPEQDKDALGIKQLEEQNLLLNKTNNEYVKELDSTKKILYTLLDQTKKDNENLNKSRKMHKELLAKYEKVCRKYNKTKLKISEQEIQIKNLKENKSPHSGALGRESPQTETQQKIGQLEKRIFEAEKTINIKETLFKNLRKQNERLKKRINKYENGKHVSQNNTRKKLRKSLSCDTESNILQLNNHKKSKQDLNNKRYLLLQEKQLKTANKENVNNKNKPIKKTKKKIQRKKENSKNLKISLHYENSSPSRISRSISLSSERLTKLGKYNTKKNNKNKNRNKKSKHKNKNSKKNENKEDNFKQFSPTTNFILSLQQSSNSNSNQNSETKSQKKNNSSCSINESARAPFKPKYRKKNNSSEMKIKNSKGTPQKKKITQKFGQQTPRLINKLFPDYTNHEILFSPEEKEKENDNQNQKQTKNSQNNLENLKLSVIDDIATENGQEGDSIIHSPLSNKNINLNENAFSDLPSPNEKDFFDDLGCLENDLNLFNIEVERSQKKKKQTNKSITKSKAKNLLKDRNSRKNNLVIQNPNFYKSKNKTPITNENKLELSVNFIGYCDENNRLLANREVKSNKKNRILEIKNNIVVECLKGNSKPLRRFDITNIKLMPLEKNSAFNSSSSSSSFSSSSSSSSSSPPSSSSSSSTFVIIGKNLRKIYSYQNNNHFKTFLKKWNEVQPELKI
ncbi:hypothetical protein M0813_27214 [Anaeramoeba flamelloides]|uniref:Uncharacterized protein n=1 Tax=Anaeramoeba flamelloides TaxID=1746091 RepID=A0ABQ8XZG2_9EUKA|nr:hypothetical protein M0813_27214 [Anaeramoeba flamelloides]